MIMDKQEIAIQFLKNTGVLDAYKELLTEIISEGIPEEVDILEYASNYFLKLSGSSNRGVDASRDVTADNSLLDENNTTKPNIQIRTESSKKRMTLRSNSTQNSKKQEERKKSKDILKPEELSYSSAEEVRETNEFNPRQHLSLIKKKTKLKRKTKQLKV